MTDNNTSIYRQRWLPLESNPSVMNWYMAKMGFYTSLYKWTDVSSTKSRVVDRIPQPVLAVILLVPVTDIQDDCQCRKQVSPGPYDDVWFIKNRIENACGTIALLHALLNAPEELRIVSIREDSWLHFFHQGCPVSLSPMAKAERLEGDFMIRMLHREAATSDEINETSFGSLGEETSETSGGSLGEDVIVQFVALVHVNGQLYELDGRKDEPVHHGNTTPLTMLKDCCEVVNDYKKRNPDIMGFPFLALAWKMK